MAFVIYGEKGEKVGVKTTENVLTNGKARAGKIERFSRLNLEHFAGNNNASGSMIDDKSKQWFGASVHSSGQDGIIVVSFHF